MLVVVVQNIRPADLKFVYHLPAKPLCLSYCINCCISTYRLRWSNHFKFIARSSTPSIVVVCRHSVPRLWLNISSGHLQVVTDNISVISLSHMSLHIIFACPLVLIPGMSTSNILLTMCSSFILVTWPYHVRYFSVIVLVCYPPGLPPRHDR